MNLSTCKGHVAMFCANAIWGLMSPVAKSVIASGAATSLVVTDLRFFGAMVLFWVTSFFQKPEHVSHKDMGKIFLASLLAIVFNQGCFMFGVSLTLPVDASIITTSMPLLAMALAALYLKEPITGKKVLGIAAGATGALVLILGSHPENTAGTAGTGGIWGDLFVLLAQLSYACYFVLFKNFVGRYSMVTLMKWMFTFAFITALPFSYTSLRATEWSAFDTATWLSVAFIVVAATFLSYSLIVVGQKNLRPTVGGMYNYVQPVVACVVAIHLGLDQFNLTKVVSVALIAGGVYLVTISRSRAQLEAYEAHRRMKN